MTLWSLSVSLRFLPLVAIPFLVWLVSYHSLMREQQALVHLRAMWVSPNSKPLSGAKWEASLHSVSRTWWLVRHGLGKPPLRDLCAKIRRLAQLVQLERL